MHVLITPSWYYDKINLISGMFVKEQAKALSDTNQLQVGLMYGKFDWGESPHMRIRTEREDGFFTMRARAWGTPKVTAIGLKIWLSRYLRLFEAYCQEKSRPDILHAHSWVAGLVAQAIYIRYGIPYVLSEHLSSVNEGTLSRRQQRLAIRAYQSAAGLTAVSRTMGRQLERLSKSDRIQVLPNSVDTEFFFQKNQQQLNPQLLLSIGDPWHTKGHDITVNALASLRASGYNMELWLGDKIPRRASLEVLIRKHNLEQHVRFLGLLSRSEVRQVMHKADIYVSASRTESFGITMIEALSCGLPVVATKTAGGIDIIGGRKELGVITEVESTQALANAIRTVANQMEHYDPQVLHNNMVERFSRQAVALQTIDIYKSVLHDHRT